MDETYLGVAAVEVVQQSIERIVTHKSAGAIGNGGGELQSADVFCHFFYWDSRKIGGWAVGVNKFTMGLVACIIGDAGVSDIDGNALRCDGGSAAGLTDAQNQIRLDFCGHIQNFFGGNAENCGYLQLV